MAACLKLAQSSFRGESRTGRKSAWGGGNGETIKGVWGQRHQRGPGQEAERRSLFDAIKRANLA